MRHMADWLVGHLALGSYSQRLMAVAPTFDESHLRFQLQPSSPWPELPSKKQSCLHGSELSPGMPVAKLDSSLSSGLTHSGSARSIFPSMSLSMPSLHWVVPTLA